MSLTSTRSIGFSEECFGLHYGHVHKADLGDGDGRKSEHILARQHYFPRWGTCWESVVGKSRVVTFFQCCSDATSRWKPFPRLEAKWNGGQYRCMVPWVCQTSHTCSPAYCFIPLFRVSKEKVSSTVDSEPFCPFINLPCQDYIKHHMIAPDGYNIGRDLLVQSAVYGGSWKGMSWVTDVEWREGLLEPGFKGIDRAGVYMLLVPHYV